MHPDDVKHALDALASEVPAPKGGAAAVVERGRRRVTQRRLTLAGIAAVLIAAVATVGAITRTDHTSHLVSSIPSTTVTTTTTRLPSYGPVTSEPPSPVAFATPTEGWICGSPLTYTTADFDQFRSGTSSVTIPDAPTPIGTRDQPPLCTASSGGDAWLVPRLRRSRPTRRRPHPFRRGEGERLRVPGDTGIDCGEHLVRRRRRRLGIGGARNGSRH